MDLTFATASELAKLIREQAVSSTEVTRAYLDQIERLNPKLNAICTLDAEHALKQSAEADTALSKGESWGPLHGVPITFKDIFETADFKTTAGYIPLKDYVPKQDATVVARLRGAGAIVLGKSNLAELAGDYQSKNSLFPAVNNPWNVNYTPGGSSGGSAAAVAAGLTALDFGNDFAGSIRQPAHFCGVYGLKPTDRRISLAGAIAELPDAPICMRQMMTVGCLARSLEDIRLSFSLIAGADPQRPDVPPVPLDTPSGKPLSALKVAWIDEWPEAPVWSEIREQMHRVVDQLVNQNIQLQQWVPECFDLSKILNLYLRLAAYASGSAQPKNRHTAKLGLPQIFRTATQGDKFLRQLCNFRRVLPEMLRPTLQGYFEVLTERDHFTAQLDTALQEWDVWITPVAATAAFTHQPSWNAIDIDGIDYPYAAANGAYVMPFNFSGHPAVVIPVGQTAEGLPMGLQIVGKRWKEMELIAIAQQIDNVIGGFKQPPLAVEN